METFLDKTRDANVGKPHLGYKFVMVGQVCSAVYARVRPVARGEVRLWRNRGQYCLLLFPDTIY